MVPTGNFGDVLAGYFALRMGLPVDRLVVATNENDILDRFWKTGRYEKKAPAASATTAAAAIADGQDNIAASSAGEVKATLSPAMDILVSSNFERLLWFLAHGYAAGAGMDEEWNRKQAGQEVSAWLRQLKTQGGFGPVYKGLLDAAREDFASERVSDPQTIDTIRNIFRELGYVLDPHSAVGVAAALRWLGKGPKEGGEGGPALVPHIALATAHPAKFSEAVDLALKGVDGYDFEAKVRPQEFIGLEDRERRLETVEADWRLVAEVVKREVDKELQALES